MPRASTPAATAAIPETPAADAAAPDTTPQPMEVVDLPAVPESNRWLFTGDGPLTYAHVPVTVQHGDVVEHLGAPAADGRWAPTEEPVTRHRDNHHSDADITEEG